MLEKLGFAMCTSCALRDYSLDVFHRIGKIVSAHVV